MLLEHDLPPASPLREAVRAAYRAAEGPLVEGLIAKADIALAEKTRAGRRARELIAHVRRERRRAGGVDALMQEYDLSSAEGVTLMCLAEALLRIPDDETAEAFIEDRLAAADFERHLGHSDSLFVNASTWGLMLAGRTVAVDDAAGPALARLAKRVGEPVIREAVRHAMRILGRQFVMGRTMEEALKRAAPLEAKGYRFSYDMLGEAARTMADADRYMGSYRAAIRAVGAAAAGRGPIAAAGVSVKLSALHPRYEFGQAARARSELKERLLELCRLAAGLGVGLCVDAEEADRLDISLDLIEAAALDPETRRWEGLGLAVQAYQKRAYPLIAWLAELAERSRRRFLVRLVKGAYWDTEIKRAQVDGQPDYPVFTRKTNTDVSYLACARALLADQAAFYPCFATHNASTLAMILEMAGGRTDLEFQRLHGMGEALYEKIVEADRLGIACRVYAPVGGHEDLLAYLVRRLLENGANTSFVNRIADDAAPIEALIADPVEKAREAGPSGHPRIPTPADLFGRERINSAGLDVTDPVVIARLAPAMRRVDAEPRRAAPLVGDRPAKGDPAPVRSPADRSLVIGEVVRATAEDAREALERAAKAHEAWAHRPADERGAILRRAADLFEAERARLMTLIVREGGRTVADAILEVREAVDFLRYYALQAERLTGAPFELPGPTGESNTLRLIGRGPFFTVAPWNFPLAIFVGQTAAALAAGCPALAKPADATVLIAWEAIRLLRQAGVPDDVVHLLPGRGRELGGVLFPDDRLAGVALTGSTETARAINKTLAERTGPIIPLIAETGGINAMIVDSTALPEQVARDVLSSAFQSAGQRCSALRLLCLQEDVADKHIAMIAGAMAELVVGDPALLSTDVGPVIDESAREALQAHKDGLDKSARKIAETPLRGANPQGVFFAPCAYELAHAGELTKEVFGPILHVVRYPAKGLDDLVAAINAAGYGLTLSIHSRAESRVAQIVRAARVGNIYVNRNQIGAVVGVQPFGGEGLSGTGPKAGGPHYLLRFLHERALTIDTTASGGNAGLMTLEG